MSFCIFLHPFQTLRKIKNTQHLCIEWPQVCVLMWQVLAILWLTLVAELPIWDHSFLLRLFLFSEKLNWNKQAVPQCGFPISAGCQAFFTIPSLPLVRTHLALAWGGHGGSDGGSYFWGCHHCPSLWVNSAASSTETWQWWYEDIFSNLSLEIRLSLDSMSTFS